MLKGHSGRDAPAMNMLWRLLPTNSRESLVSGRVRIRRLTCVTCRCRTWVVVGPPRCPDCAAGTSAR